MNPALIAQLRIILKDIGKELANSTFQEIVQSIESRIGNLVDYAGSLEDLIKYAWNYEEKYCQTYSLEEAIKWFKSNLNNDVAGGCMLKRPSLHGGYVLHHCFMDHSRSPLLSGDYPHKVVYALSLSQDLREQFGSKDMLIFN